MDPQRQGRPSTRPRSKSAFSFKSDKSGSDTKQHKRKESLFETSAEKRKNHMSETTKANPNAAIHEAQPIAAALEESTLANLSNVRCNDIWGKPISEPDRSNPTRSRFERPLETIRGFEFAIDRAYKERTSAYLNLNNDGFQSRRNSSLWQGNNGSHAAFESPQRFSQYSGQHPNHSGHFARRDSYGEGGYGPPPNGRFGPRQNSSDTGLNRYNTQGSGLYPPAHSRSRDTLNTRGSSGSEQWKDSAVPSEENSIDKANGVIKSQANGYTNGYQNGHQGGYQNGYQNGPSNSQSNGYSNGYDYPPNYQNGNGSYGSQPSQGGYQNPGAVQPPAPPPKGMIRLDKTAIPTGAVQPPASEKRQSWFKRRFSKN